MTLRSQECYTSHTAVDRVSSGGLIAAVASPWLRPVARCQLITTGWSASAGSPRHLQGASHTNTFPQFLEVKEDGLDLAAARAPKKCCK